MAVTSVEDRHVSSKDNFSVSPKTNDLLLFHLPDIDNICY